MRANLWAEHLSGSWAEGPTGVGSPLQGWGWALEVSLAPQLSSLAKKESLKRE